MNQGKEEYYRGLVQPNYGSKRISIYYIYVEEGRAQGAAAYPSGKI